MSDGRESPDPKAQSPARESVLVGEGLWRVFQTGPERLEVLSGADIAVRRGELVAIVGPSGTGKSTLLHILGGLDRPTRGRVLLDSIDIFGYPDNRLPALRNRKVGFVFQFHHLLSEFDVLENAAMPLLINGVGRAEALDRAHETLRDIGFTTRLAHRPSELSGGEKARVALARALVTRPAVILADEPTGNLDVASGGQMVDLFVRLSAEQGMTTIVVTHNPSVAARATRRLRLAEGRLFDEAV
jgi:lipoprotein-releasing system ATP-binding protein